MTKLDRPSPEAIRKGIEILLPALARIRRERTRKVKESESGKTIIYESQ